ncbi:MAG: protoheme IX farnesyltransferase [Phycisphaerales bacterium]|nr:protoheme IX farnesyltransferase [Phycisphaerales bacterium]
MQSVNASTAMNSFDNGVSLSARVGAFSELAKARLSGLVVATAAVGYVVGAGDALAWIVLLATIAGTALSAFSANAWNQIIEIERDARMQRTRNRPLPSGRLSRGEAVAFAVVAGVAGPLTLWVAGNWLAATLAVMCEFIYIAVYTPLKPRSPLNTLVGAVVGGIPPMIGWAAATGSLGLGAWLLGAILFAWQIPHFLALAWMYREDYERGGFRMLPIIDPAGVVTCHACVVYSAVLVPLAMMATVQGLAGWSFAFIGGALGALMTAASVVLCMSRSNANARRVFFSSLIYLPLLLGALVLNRSSVDPGKLHVARHVFLDGSAGEAPRELEARNVTAPRVEALASPREERTNRP